jgi:hypothetical protein
MEAASLSMSMKATGVSVTVPNNDIARLMYYLNCVNVCLRIDELDSSLLDYANHWRLSPARRQAVVQIALILSPDELLDKVFFRDDDGDITDDSANEFCDVTVACDLIQIDSSAIIAGTVQNVRKVMFFKTSWLRNNYFGPMTRLNRPAPTRTIVYQAAPQRRNQECVIS